MIKVRIIRKWQYPDIFRQTPGGKGIWDGIRFFEGDLETCDFVIVSNYTWKSFKVVCPPENIWSLMQEPPNEYFGYFHRAHPVYSRVFTQDTALTSSRYIHSQPAIAWQVNKSYDYLKKCPVPLKRKKLSWVTSAKTAFIGHVSRMLFLQKLRRELKFDLLATLQYNFAEKKRTKELEIQIKNKLLCWGFDDVVEGKWETLAPYKYSLAIENFSGPWYWSEKIADCFLSWTMPIYYGCTNLSDYFPKESYININISDPQAAEIINRAISNNLWEKNFKAISKARSLILEKYQFFPYFAGLVHEWRNSGKNQQKVPLIIPSSLSLRSKLNHYIWRINNHFS